METKEIKKQISKINKQYGQSLELSSLTEGFVASVTIKSSRTNLIDIRALNALAYIFNDSALWITINNHNELEINLMDWTK